MVDLLTLWTKAATGGGLLGLVIGLTIVGCKHQEPQREVVVIAAPRPIVNPRLMPEAEAVAQWLETGVYRGLTDDEWINLMISIEALKHNKAE